MCGCVYVWVFNMFCLFVFCNVLVCVRMDFVMFCFVCVWVL